MMTTTTMITTATTTTRCVEIQLNILRFRNLVFRGTADIERDGASCQIIVISFVIK